MEGAFPKLVDVIGASNNDAILLVVVLCIAVYVAGRPLYQVVADAQQKKRKQYFERERLLISVITDNSSVISKLTNLLESTNQNCHECRETQTTLLKDMSDKQDEIWIFVNQDPVARRKYKAKKAKEEIHDELQKVNSL